MVSGTFRVSGARRVPTGRCASFQPRFAAFSHRSWPFSVFSSIAARRRSIPPECASTHAHWEPTHTGRYEIPITNGLNERAVWSHRRRIVCSTADAKRATPGCERSLRNDSHRHNIGGLGRGLLHMRGRRHDTRTDRTSYTSLAINRNLRADRTATVVERRVICVARVEPTSLVRAKFVSADLRAPRHPQGVTLQ